ESNVKPPIRTTGTPATSSWQDIDLSKNIDTGATLSSPSSEPEFSDSFLALSSNEYHASLHDEDFSDMQGAAATSTPSTNDDDSLAEALLRELEENDEVSTNTPLDSTQVAEPLQEAPQTTHITPTIDVENEATDEELDDWLNEGLFDELLLPEPSPEPIPPPTNIFRRPGINWWQQVKWALLCLMLVVVLFAQYLYFNFEKIARAPEHRPLIAQLCELAGCQLPSMSNLNRIRSQHLVIRNHPEYEDALQMDALLYNLAEHDQPFPNLGLEFSNNQGDIVASRLFKPSDYLSGNLKEAEFMPSSTPVRISLTLTNPGSDAINH